MKTGSKVTDSKNRTRLAVKVMDPDVKMNASNDSQWTGTKMRVTARDQKGMKYTVQFEWTRTKSGARPTRIVIDGLGKTEITSDLLRALPIRELKSMDVEKCAQIMMSAQRGIDLLNSLQDNPFFPQKKNPARAVTRSLKKPRKLGSRISDDEYLKVARLFHEKTALGYSNISQAMARDLYCSAPTVRKRIAECRKRGLIPPAAKKGRR